MPSDALMARAAHLLASHGSMGLGQCSEHHLVLGAGKRRLILIDDHPDGPELAGVLLKAHRHMPVELVVVGAEAERRPDYARRMLSVTSRPHHLYLGNEGSGPSAQAATERLPDGPPPQAFVDWVARAGLELEGRRSEIGQWAQDLNARPAWATVVLIGWIVAVFALTWVLQLKLAQTPVLLHLGALAPVEGEPWRLLSAGSLHIGLMHLGFNSWVLWIMGRSQERLLGSGRMVLLFVLSVFGGTVLSGAMHEGLSAGASGGVWGLFAAQALMVWRQPELIPEALRKATRDGALKVLGLNLLISFIPGVDLWGHLGGGLAGGAAFLATTRMPSRGTWTQAVAASGVALFIAASVVAITLGAPWRLLQEPTIEVGAPGETVGDLDHDAGVTFWQALDEQPEDLDTLLAWAVEHPVEGMGPPAIVELAGAEVVFMERTGDLNAQRALAPALFEDGSRGVLLVEAAWWQGAPWEGVLADLLLELRTTPDLDHSGDPVHVISDSWGTSYPVDQVSLSLHPSDSVTRLELVRHDGSVKELSHTREGSVLHFDPVNANEGVRLDRFRVTLEHDGKPVSVELEVQYTEEFDE